MVEVGVGGTALRLLPQRAAYVPSARALLVADVHFGKAVSFRRLGVPVPSGTTAATLAALSDLIAGTGAARVVFLGDLLHAARSRTAATVAAVRDWRAGHSGIEMTLVRGNHDRRAGDPPRDWSIGVVDAPLRLEGAAMLALAHHPAPLAGAYVLAGHVHPAAVVGSRGERLRLPCFHFGAEVGVLPAFGGFTGMHVLPRAPGDRVWVVAGDEVRPLR